MTVCVSRQPSGQKKMVDFACTPQQRAAYLIKGTLMWANCDDLDETGRQLLVELIQGAITLCGKGTETESHECTLRMYRLMTQYSCLGLPRGFIYQRLHEEGCFISSALFYRDWAEAVMMEKKSEKARDIIQRARANRAEPIELIDRIEASMGMQREDTFMVRGHVMQVIGDPSQSLLQLLRNEQNPSGYSCEQLHQVFSTSRVAEVLDALNAPIAEPSKLPAISLRLRAVRDFAGGIALRVLNEADAANNNTLPNRMMFP